MKPVCPVVKSSILTSSAFAPPARIASKMCTRTRSPGLINRVWSFGVKLSRLASCGLGGPVGTPSLWMKAKLVGSMQFGLQ